MRGTRLGLAIRAMAERPDAAGLMGIDTARAAAIVSFVSGALAGAGGVLIGLNFNAIQPYMGEEMMLRGFVVIIVGGLGDIRGALIAGLLLGMLEVLTAGYIVLRAEGGRRLPRSWSSCCGPGRPGCSAAPRCAAHEHAALARRFPLDLPEPDPLRSASTGCSRCRCMWCWRSASSRSGRPRSWGSAPIPRR